MASALMCAVQMGNDNLTRCKCLENTFYATATLVTIIQRIHEPHQTKHCCSVAVPIAQSPCGIISAATMLLKLWQHEIKYEMAQTKKSMNAFHSELMK